MSNVLSVIKHEKLMVIFNFQLWDNLQIIIKC
jgi:hypothetical protein